MNPARQAWSLLAWGTALALPACAPSAPPAAVMRERAAASVPATPAASGLPEAVTGSCNAAPAQAAVGRPGTPELAEWARQQAGARRVRVIGHDDLITKDYDTGRLNLQLDPGGKVVRVYCG